MAKSPAKPADTRSDHAAILAEARERFKLCANAESDLRERQLEDKKFAAGEHWPARIKRERQSDGRPCLTIDRLTPQIKQVTNQQRASRPEIKIKCSTGGKPETAEILQGLVRHIEQQSDADDAYDQSGKDQAEIGRGWIKIRTDYEDDESFNQVIVIDRVRNPFRIYMDPAAEKRDCSDAMYAFEVIDFLPEDYRKEYPRSDLASLSDFKTLGDNQPEWFPNGAIRVVHYWRVETEEVEIKQGERARTVKRRKVECQILNAIEVLESYDWPGKWIPLVPVIGEEVDIEGAVDYRGMVRRAKDPQRMFNFWKSATTEMVALAPRAPFIVAEGQIEPYKLLWQQANSRNLPVLPYKPTTVAGSLAPPPQRQVAEPPIQALLVSTQAAENDLRAATGFFDVDQRESREQSGRAILARQRQGELGNSDFMDGLARAIRHVGRIIIDLIPHIYDVPRVVRIAVPNTTKEREVMVHAGGQAPMALPPGVEGVYDLSVGKYDVTVSVGPSFLSQRAEFVEMMSQIMQGNPALWQIAGDVVFENMDIPNASVIAERLRKMLPPHLQEGGQDISPEAQAMIAQMREQMAEMQTALQEAQQTIESKRVEAESRERIKAAELDAKERQTQIEASMERLKLQTEAAIAQMKIDAENARALMSAAMRPVKPAGEGV